MPASLDKHQLADLIQGVVCQDRRSVARTLRWVDDSPPSARLIATQLHPHCRGAQIIGVTGNPGAGKSTIVDAMIEQIRRRGQTTAVLAVDPSSPFSGGAILGDRIRMNRHATDDGVFIRSLATRGALGGLSRAAFDASRVLDAAGFDVILIETVGVGQDEVDVARLAHTTVVVMVPGLGDDVQAIKAGLLEIADLFLINKADRSGADEVERSLRQALTLVPGDTGWEIPVLRSVASRGEGIPELLDAVARHRDFLKGPAGARRIQTQTREQFDRLLDAALVDEGRRRLSAQLSAARERVIQGADPYAEILDLVPAAGGKAPP